MGGQVPGQLRVRAVAADPGENLGLPRGHLPQPVPNPDGHYLAAHHWTPTSIGWSLRTAQGVRGRASPAVTTWLSRLEQAQVGIAGFGARLGGDHPAAQV